jgi:nucleoside-diphosphate-sugar epimerase
MKYLVTGGAGFIGSHLTEFLLQNNHEVVVIDNFCDYYPISLKRQNQKSIDEAGAKIIEADLTEESTYELLDKDFDFVIHLAAQPGIDPNSSFDSYLKNNLLATKRLVDFSLQLKELKMFINIGTSSVYGSFATCTEEQTPMPTSYYGVTKLASEQLVLAEARKDKLKACSLRLYSVFGPRERPEKLFTKLIECAIHNKKFPLYEGSEEHLRSFTYVEDIVKGIYQASKTYKLINTEIVNLGNHEQRTTKDGILAVENQLKTHIDLKILSPREGDQLSTQALVKKARLLFNYRADTSLEKGIAKQIQWYINTQIKHEKSLHHHSRI